MDYKQQNERIKNNLNGGEQRTLSNRKEIRFVEKKSPDLKKGVKWLHEKTNKPYTTVKEQYSEREDRDEWGVFGELVGCKIRALAATHYARATVQRI